MGMYAEDGDDDELSGFLTSGTPMSDEQKAALIDKVGLGSNIADDRSVKAAQGESDHRNKMTGIFEGLSTALAGPGKTDSGYYSGLRGQAQDRVKGAENAFKDRQRVAQYIIGRDDKLRGLQAQKQASEDKMTKEQEFRAGESQKDRESREKMNGADIAARASLATTGAKAEKAQRDDELLAIDGYERAPGMRVRPEDAAKLRNGKATIDTLNKNMDAYRDLVKKNGTFEWGGKAGGAMESLQTSILMDLKGLYELGVLSGPDKALMESQIADPSSISSIFKSDKRTASGLDTTKQTLNQRFNDKLAASGYKSRAQAPAGNGSSGDFGGGTAVAAPKPQYKVGDTKELGGKTFVRTEAGWVQQ